MTSTTTVATLFQDESEEENGDEELNNISTSFPHKTKKRRLQRDDEEGNDDDDDDDGEEEAVVIPSLPNAIMQVKTLETLPDEPSRDSYKNRPISSFGMGLIRGMGFQDDKVGVGERARKVNPYLLQGRPQLLGLGAKPPPSSSTATSSSSTTNPHNKKRLYLTVGSLVRLKDLGERYGVVTQTDGVPGLECIRIDTSAVLPGMAPSQREHGEEAFLAMIVPRAAVELVPNPESLPHHHLGRLVYLRHEDWMRTVASSSSSSSSSAPQNTREWGEWTTPGLRVRMVDPRSPHYKKKGRVVAVSTKMPEGMEKGGEENGGKRRVHCTVELEGGGEAVRGVRERHLQTLIPDRGGRVMVVVAQDTKGRALPGVMRGAIGTVMRTKKGKRDAEEVEVAMDNGESQITFPVDNVCACD